LTSVLQEAHPTPQEGAVVTASASSAEASAAGTLLLVDDEQTNLTVLQEGLVTAGYRLLTASNGSEALDVLANEAPDLILLDLMMPEMDGFTVCQRIRACPQWGAIPIIVLTALETPADYVRALDSGADDFLTKPFHVAVLQARVRSHLRRKRGDDSLREAKETAEVANVAKSAFLANMSHELRTPLHHILSFSSFGMKNAQTTLPEKLCRYFQQIDTSGRALLSLVNNLLDLSTMESGAAVFTYQTVDLALLTTMVVAEYEVSLTEQQLTIHWHEPGEMIEVKADPEKMTQVLQNLLSNAVKFSPQGGTITLDIAMVGSAVRVKIEDQGPGIPEDECDTIFDAFVQSGKTKTGAGGTGLGLAICREIIMSHQGRIWVENGTERGAVFTVELPLQRQDNVTSAP
jgi:signal transduction histidine kinase